MKKDKKYKILMSGGGTGGHIFPAIAIANGLKDKLRDVDILFVGARGRMEMEKVPMAGYPIEGLWISGIQRRLTLQNLIFPVKLLSSLWKASRILKTFQPDAAIGTGGYASGPTLKAAASKGIPTLILEQNSYPGMTNKWLGRSVNRICTAYEGMEKYFPAEKIVLTGSPVRKSILNLSIGPEEGRRFFDLEKNRKTLLVIGGSQGAKRINEALAQNVEMLLANGIQLIWQTGRPSLEMAEKAVLNSKYRKRVKVVDFIHNMEQAYAAADLIVSRAGAIAIAEIVQVKKPAIFIPLPSAAEDHQTHNAMALVSKGAALMVKERNASERLVTLVNQLMKEDQKREEIVAQLKQFEYGNATDKIVNEVERLIMQSKSNG